MSRTGASSGDSSAPRNRLILGLLDHVGLRPAEISGLRVEDVDLEQSELAVVRGGTTIALPFGPAVGILIEEQLDRLPSLAPRALLVPSTRRRPLSAAQIRRIAREGAASKGGAAASPRARRAAHGLRLLDRGAEPEWVALRLGLARLPRKWKRRKRKRRAAAAVSSPPAVSASG